MARKRTRARFAASIAALLLAFGVAAGWPALVDSPAGVEAIPIFPILTFKPIITFVPIDSLLTVNIPDANLNMALHDACGIVYETTLKRGDLYALNGDLSLYDKGIQDLEGIQFLKNVTDLGLSKNPITRFPTISGLANLQTLRLDGCGLEEVPPEVIALPSLYYLTMRDNALTVLPDSLATHATLSGLFVDRNQIREIPAAFGSSGLFTLTISFNRIATVPDAVIQSPVLDNLILTGNRLTTLSPKFGARSWENLDFEFNFLDVTPGGTLHTMLKDIVAATCEYERQLAPIAGLVATPSATSIRLSWDKCPDFGEAGWSAKVTRYLVYRNEGGTLTELALPGPETPEFTETGLAPSLARSYTVGVEYEIVDPSKNGITRNYRTIATGTTGDVTPVPESTATPGPSDGATPDPTSGPTSEATPTEGAAGGGTSGLPPWAFVVGGVVLLGAIGGGTALGLALAKARGTPKPPQA